MKEDILNYMKQALTLNNEVTKLDKYLNKKFKGIKVILNNNEYTDKLGKINSFNLFEDTIEIYYICDEIIDGEDNICVDYIEIEDFFNGVVEIVK